MCKGGDVFSLAVLIDRGLDLVFRVVPSFPGCPTPRSSSLLFFSLYSVLRALSLNIVGADGGGGTPVPIPNTAVKPICAHDTWLEAARENRQAPTLRRPSGLSGGPFFWLPDYSRGADSFFCRLFRTFQLFKESENHIMNC